MSSSWGEKVKISIFGESHGEAIGVNIDGLPAGEKIDMEAVLLQMSRRAPGKDKTATTRLEADKPEVLSGLLDGVTTGAPLCAIIRNTNQRSKDYSDLKIHPRPGHADYSAEIRYKGHNDVRGGGHFSGRLTAPLVFAGAVCRQILERRGIVIGAHASSIGSVKDVPIDPVNITGEELNILNKEFFSVISTKSKNQMYEEVERYKEQADSIGGSIECAVTGVPAGFGDPMFGGVENVFASILFGIPAVKGVEFGAGFEAAKLPGSVNNDEFYYDGNGAVKTRSNNCGGILGGITTGMPLVFRVAVKPTPSIGKAQQTVDLKEKKSSELVISGRHDPCIVPRAIPVVEAAAAVALMNILELR